MTNLKSGQGVGWVGVLVFLGFALVMISLVAATHGIPASPQSGGVGNAETAASGVLPSKYSLAIAPGFGMAGVLAFMIASLVFTKRDRPHVTPRDTEAP